MSKAEEKCATCEWREMQVLECSGDENCPSTLTLKDRFSGSYHHHLSYYCRKSLTPDEDCPGFKEDDN